MQAKAMIIAPKIGGAKLSDGTLQAADGQLAGTPSVMVDAIAVVLSVIGVTGALLTRISPPRSPCW